MGGSQSSRDYFFSQGVGSGSDNGLGIRLSKKNALAKNYTYFYLKTMKLHLTCSNYVFNVGLFITHICNNMFFHNWTFTHLILYKMSI